MKVLIVEDNKSDRELLKFMLEERFQHNTKFREASSLSTALDLLAQGDINCVLLDLHLPDSHGRETFTKIQVQYPEVPIVVMTHTQDRTLAVELVRLGAADYVTKDYTDEEGIFQRILLAIEKHKHSVRMPAEDAASIHKIESARAKLMEAHRSGSDEDVRVRAVETTAATADLARRMFTEIQKLSTASDSQGAKLSHVIEVSNRLQLEFLEGSLNQPSVKSRLGHLESSVRHLQEDLRGTERNVEHIRTERSRADQATLRVAAPPASRPTETSKPQVKPGAMFIWTAIGMVLLLIVGACFL